MKFEIERKFLVKNNWPKPAKGIHCLQGYICSNKDNVVRVRTMAERGWLTIKSLKTLITRLEYEYEIPIEDARILLDAVCKKPLIEKNRYSISVFGMNWEIDEFLGENLGLITAEIELEREDQTVDLPDWIGEEVTHDVRYLNFNLVLNPFTNWK